MDPRMEEVLKKITMLQKVHEKSEAEQKELDKELAAKQSDLQTLLVEKASLREEAMQKQETIRILKLQHEHQIKKEKRQQEQVEGTMKRIDDMTTRIKEEKMKQRQQRIEYQEQLEDMMKKHKALAKLYNPKRLGAEIEQMKEQKKELLQKQQETLAKLKELEETETKLREEGVLTSENLFLRSEQAACAIKLLEEENENAKRMLEDVTARHTEALSEYNRLKSCLEDAERKLLKVPQAPLDEPQPEMSRGAGLSSAVLFLQIKSTGQPKS